MYAQSFGDETGVMYAFIPLLEQSEYGDPGDDILEEAGDPTDGVADEGGETKDFDPRILSIEHAEDTFD